MTEEKFIELVNKEIDGLNTPKESAELKAHLQANSEARHLYDDLAKLSTILNRVEEVDSPASLKADIMASIKKEREAVKSQFSFAQWIQQLVESRTAFQYVYAFAAGIVLGVTIYSLVGRNSTTSAVMDPYSMSGSIIINNSTYPFSQGQSFQVNLESEGISAAVQTKYSQNLAVVEVDIHSKNEVDLVFEYDTKSLQFKGYSQSRASAGNMKVTENTFQMSSQGENHYILAFERLTQEPSEITVRILESDKQIYEKSVLIGQSK